MYPQIKKNLGTRLSLVPQTEYYSSVTGETKRNVAADQSPSIHNYSREKRYQALSRVSIFKGESLGPGMRLLSHCTWSSECEAFRVTGSQSVVDSDGSCVITRCKVKHIDVINKQACIKRK